MADALEKLGSRQLERLPASSELSEPLRRLLELDRSERRRVIKSLAPRQRERLLYDWAFWGRPAQIWRPGPEIHTVYLAGRGWGKTRTGAEAVQYVADHPELCGGRSKRNANDRNYGLGGWIGIAGRTANDVNETMLYGPSGLMSIAPPWNRPKHYPSKKKLVWPNGVVARLMSGDVPESFRGPNFGFVWTDELAHWAKLAQSLTQLQLTHRHGRFPRGVHTATPLPTEAFLRFLFECDESGQPRPAGPGEASYNGLCVRAVVRAVQGSTYDNLENLAANFLSETVSTFEGTEEGDQELHGGIILSVRGAPWSRDWIRRVELDNLPELASVVVGVDPTVSDGLTDTKGEKIEAGIVAVGLGEDRRVYLLEDRSRQMSTVEWARAAVDLALRWDADEIAVEDNQGGELVETAINTAIRARQRRRIKVRRVHAGRSGGNDPKAYRAGLVAPLWELGQASHVGDPRRLIRLEHQMCTYQKGRPSDRMDALVWAMLALVGDATDRKRLSSLSDAGAWRRIAEELQRRERRR